MKKIVGNNRDCEKVNKLFAKRDLLYARTLKLVKYLNLEKFDKDFAGDWFKNNFFDFVFDILLDSKAKLNSRTIGDDLVLLYLAVGLVIRARMPEADLQGFLKTAVELCSKSSKINRYNSDLTVKRQA